MLLKVSTVQFVSLLVDMEVCVKAVGSENQRVILNVDHVVMFYLAFPKRL